MKVNRQSASRCEPAFNERPSWFSVASLGRAVLSPFEHEVGRESTVVSLESRDSLHDDGVTQY
jgi:hypothetical protein